MNSLNTRSLSSQLYLVHITWLLHPQINIKNWIYIETAIPWKFESEKFKID